MDMFSVFRVHVHIRVRASGKRQGGLETLWYARVVSKDAHSHSHSHTSGAAPSSDAHAHGSWLDRLVHVYTYTLCARRSGTLACGHPPHTYGCYHPLPIAYTFFASLIVHRRPNSAPTTYSLFLILLSYSFFLFLFRSISYSFFLFRISYTYVSRITTYITSYGVNRELA